MDIECLSIEITRRCNLKCEHCLRGDSRNEYMSSETIHNVFKDIKAVDQLLLTGGEPLLALNQIKEIANVIRENKIDVKTIWIGTNGTVLSDKVIDVLRELQKVSTLKIVVSSDIFHDLELERLGLYKKRMDNTKVMELVFDAIDEGEYDIPEEATLSFNGVNYKKIIAAGRAKNLTEERLDEINSKLTNYEILPCDLRCLQFEFPEINIETNRIDGSICVDVRGNVTGANFSFDEEDEDIRKYESNLNKIDIFRAMVNFRRYYWRLFYSLNPYTSRMILKEVVNKIEERQARKRQK